MNKTADQIKTALLSGLWKDSEGVILQINQHKVTFKALIENGALNIDVMSKINFDDSFIIERIKIEKLDINVLESILTKNQYQSIVDKLQNITTEEKGKEIEMHIDNINNRTYSDEKIKELFDSGVFNRNELLKRTNLTNEEISIILNEPIPDLEPPELPPYDKEVLLLSSCTDVFTFGVAGSGKSLFLGALFTYAEQNKLYRTWNAHQAAIIYTDYLIKAIKTGRPIKRTETNTALYLPVTFKNKNRHFVKKMFGKTVEKQKFHPFNFIEISGEDFEDVYTSNTDNVFKWLEDYLFLSKNKKIFFFAIDYFIHHSNTEEQLNASQSAQFMNVLNFIKRSSLVKETIAICLVITKWDYCLDRTEESAVKFLREYYGNLYETCEDLTKEYKHLEFNVFTFSIGDVKPSKAFKYRPEKSEGIFEWLCDVSFFELRD